MAQRIEEVIGELGCGRDRYEQAVAGLQASRRRYVRLWSYYGNPMRDVGQVTDLSERPYRQAQEWGLPERITGYRAGVDPLHDGSISDKERKEVVVENDIAWRVDTMVDYLFGRMPQIHSLAADAGKAREIGSLLAAIIECNGGVQLMQQIALGGAVYGFVDIAVTLDTEKLNSKYEARNTKQGGNGDNSKSETGNTNAKQVSDFDTRVSDLNLKRASDSTALADTGNTLPDGELAATGASEGVAPAQDMPIMDMARLVLLQVVEPARSLVITDSSDITNTFAFGQLYEVAASEEAVGLTGAIRKLLGSANKPSRAQVLELWSDRGWWRWRDGELEASGGNTLGRIPVVHIQNSAVPFSYGGASDVEPLIPLQDELNTRLCDRAHRIAVQSFKMYLGKNVDVIAEPPAPSRAWNVTTMDADVKELGGDASCPAEQTHIADVREAMDRASGVPPVAAGAIRNRIGNLTSAAALRITLMSLLARTERKRALYGAGMKRMCELALAWLDVAGVYRTSEEERGMEIHWPSPLPENNSEMLAEAKLKLDLGVGKEVVLKELGY